MLGQIGGAHDHEITQMLTQSKETMRLLSETSSLTESSSRDGVNMKRKSAASLYFKFAQRDRDTLRKCKDNMLLVGTMQIIIDQQVSDQRVSKLICTSTCLHCQSMLDEVSVQSAQGSQTK